MELKVTKTGDMIKNLLESDMRAFSRQLMEKLKNIKETSISEADRKDRIHNLGKQIELRDPVCINLMEELTRK